MKFYFFLLIIMFAFSSTLVYSQEVDSIAMSMEEGKVVVKYDFNDGEPGIDYELYLYGSHDNFLNPLKYATGDLGKRIQVGKGKIIYWDAQKELGNFRGDFRLKIKGVKYVPFVDFKNISQNLKIKRGQSFDIRWETSEKTSQIKLDILRYGVPIAETQLLENTGKYTWQIPKNTSAGNGYVIQITNTENPLREETSAAFDIKRKIPLIYKVVPVAVVAGAAIVLLSQEKPTSKPGIPEPPGTPY